MINYDRQDGEREYPNATNLVFGPAGEHVAVLPSTQTPAEPEPDLADGATKEPIIVVADVATGMELWQRPVRGRIAATAFNRKGDLLAGIDAADGKIGLWNLKTNQHLWELPAKGMDFATFPVLSSDGQLAAVRHGNPSPFESEKIQVLETDTSQQLAEDPVEAFLREFSIQPRQSLCRGSGRRLSPLQS